MPVDAPLGVRPGPWPLLLQRGIRIRCNHHITSHHKAASSATRLCQALCFLIRPQQKQRTSKPSVATWSRPAFGRVLPRDKPRGKDEERWRSKYFGDQKGLPAPPLRASWDRPVVRPSPSSLRVDAISGALPPPKQATSDRLSTGLMHISNETLDGAGLAKTTKLAPMTKWFDSASSTAFLKPQPPVTPWTK
ncbi:hypothetical protein LZ30DRAFT_245857 [Colletotrichum cereale]|nr:hypothetical protein LZ30DRAFT_245857 [Colletotrichum cereale]